MSSSQSSIFFLNGMSDMISELGDLADPAKFRQPVEFDNVSRDDVLAWYRKLVEIRKVEELTADIVLSGEVYTPCHLSIGQEAVAVGVVDSLTADDFIYSNHRSHAHFLALGGPMDGLLAEILCRDSGVSGGYGGSQHLTCEEVGFRGSVPIVGATIPIAVGAAFSAKYNKTSNIAVAFFGDGACEEGVVHECLNLASIAQLPILFVCENNLYSSHLDISLRQPNDRVARFADAHNIANRTIDGNDVAEVAQVAGELIDGIRATGKPAFLEAVTYRLIGHVGGRRDVDVGLRRSAELLEGWMMRDPIIRVRAGIAQSEVASIAELDAIDADIEEHVQSIYQRVRQQPEPNGLKG